MVAKTQSEPITTPSPAAASGEQRPELTLGTGQHRRQKILEYIAETAAQGSALEATIANVNGDLMLLSGQFVEDHEQIRALEPDPRERLNWLEPVANQVLRLSRQIGGFTNIAMRLQKERQPSQRPETPTSLAADAQVTDSAGPAEPLPAGSTSPCAVLPPHEVLSHEHQQVPTAPGGEENAI